MKKDKANRPSVLEKTIIAALSVAIAAIFGCHKPLTPGVNSPTQTVAPGASDNTAGGCAQTANLTHGPRLGAPSPGGFKVWLRFDGPAKVTLQTRRAGTPAWTVSDAQAVETSKYNTVVLTADGLESATEYEYRILAGSIEVASSSTYTMPAVGRFVAYNVSDQHGMGVQASYDWILSDWESNYEPSGIPALIFQTGDLYNLRPDQDTRAKAMEDCALPAIGDLAGADRACSRLPLCFMWDDFDFAGNNSSKDRQVAFGSEDDPYGAALEVWDWLWRDHARPAYPSTAYAVEVAGMPFIVTDTRSQRTPQTGAHPGSDGIAGDESWPSTATALGDAQREWLISTLGSYAIRELVILVSGSTFRDQIAAHLGGVHHSTRDSIGIWFKGERNHVLREGWIKHDHGSHSHLVVWSGDDHRNSVFSGTAGTPEPAIGGNYPGQPLPVSFTEFKVISGPKNMAILANTIFGNGELFEWSGPDHDCVVRWDITSLQQGASISARATYFHISGSQDPPGAGAIPKSASGISAGESGDFCFSEGLFSHCIVVRKVRD